MTKPSSEKGGGRGGWLLCAAGPPIPPLDSKSWRADVPVAGVALNSLNAANIE